MNWKYLVVAFVAMAMGLVPAPARACLQMQVPRTPVNVLIDATTEHLTRGKDVPQVQKPFVDAVSLFEPYGMTSWVQGKRTGEYLFIESHDKWVFVGGKDAHYSAEDLVRLFHVPKSAASALVDRFIKLQRPVYSQLSAP